MRKLYVIRREDMFDAMTKGMLPEGTLAEVGSIWLTVAFTDEQKNRYGYVIAEA